MSTSVTNIQNRLHSGEYGVNIVAFSNEIATPTNPSDLEHSAFTRQSDINEELSRKTRLHKIPVNLLLFTEEDPVVSLSNADLIDLLGCNASEFESSFANTEVVFSVQEKKYTLAKTFAVLSEYTKDNTNVHRFVGIDGNLTIILSFLITENQLHIVQYTEGFLEVHETETTVTDAVKYTQQSLTAEQLALARLNIGVSEVIPYDIADGTITTAKLANSAVVADKLHNNAVTTEKISNNAITTEKISSGAITSGKIASGAISNDKLSSSLNDSIANISNKQDVLVSGTNIKTINGSSILGSGNLVVSGGGGTSILDGSVTTSKLADNAVTMLKIADNSVTTQKLSSEVQTLLNTSGSAGNNSILTMSEEYTDDEILTVREEYLSNAGYLGDYNQMYIIPGFDPQSDCLRTNTIQTLTATLEQNVKNNVFNKNIMSYVTGQGLGVKYIKQHIINGNNVLTQDDFDDTDTLYIIDYDFAIQGTSSNPIIIPNNCKILFLGGSFSGGYININGAEVLPSYSSIMYSPTSSPTTVFGSPKKGSTYFNDVYNRPVFFNGTSWLFGDGSSTTTPFVRIDVPTYQNNPSIPVGYMFYNSNDNKLYVLTGISNSQYTWRTILCEQNPVQS